MPNGALAPGNVLPKFSVAANALTREVRSAGAAAAPTTVVAAMPVTRMLAPSAAAHRTIDAMRILPTPAGSAPTAPSALAALAALAALSEAGEAGSAG